MGDKKSVENPVKCVNYHILAKTIIIAGGKDNNLGYSAGQPLEVIPLTNPHTLKQGDKLSLKVLFDGKPLANATVKATYAGFEADDIAPHAVSKKDAKADSGKRADKNDTQKAKRFPVETLTDESGQAAIQLNEPGYWMILLSHKPPFADPQICDECMYNMAFTFQINTQNYATHPRRHP